MAVATATKYPTVARVLRASIEGQRRRRVLAVIAAYLDEGHAPSLREIAERAKVDDWKRAQALVKRLEADGLLRVEWVKTPHRSRRNRYEILV